MSRILLFGATGLVGRHVLDQALRDPRIDRIVAPSRRALPANAAGAAAAGKADNKLENPQVDFDALPADASWWAADAAICTLGTTIRKAGSREAFRRVDVDYVKACAALAKRHGVGRFALTSAMFADAGSRSFYLRCKGEAEDAVRALGFSGTIIVRPSLIGGEREEKRTLEHLGLRVTGLLSPLLPRRHRISPAENIAAALIEGALGTRTGEQLVLSDTLVAD